MPHATAPPGHHEHRSIAGGQARAAVFGVSDGLVSNISLILGFAGSGVDSSVVRLAGLAGLLAGAISMGAGEWVSVTAQNELIGRLADRSVVRSAARQVLILLGACAVTYALGRAIGVNVG